MNKTFSIAVIIPTLNEERFIAQCLDSVLEQTYPIQLMDIMVIDGGSTDKTCNIVDDYHKKYSNIRLLHNPKRIQSVAFNIGVANSTSPYVIRLDAHAIYNKTYIENCINIYSANADVLGFAPELLGNVGGVCSIRPQHSGIIPEAAALLNSSKFGIGGAAFRVGVYAGVVDTVPFGCFPRKVIEQVGGMREDLPRGEDNEYNSRIRKAGYKIYLDPEIVCTYFARDTIKSNMKQMYNNGVSIGHLAYIDRDAIGLRHLVPLIFVLGLLFGAVISIIWHPFGWIYLNGISTYLLCALFAAIHACKERSSKYILPLVVLFACVHVSYGVGTIVGIVHGLRTKS